MGDNLAILIGPTLASLALYVWVAASLHAVFRKAGEESWQAWVPVLNLVVLLRLGGLSGWWTLLLLVPGLGAIALAVVVWVACHRINASFGVGAGMTVLAILLFPVWSSILGWGSARWIGREQPLDGRAQPSAAPGRDGRVIPGAVSADAAPVALAAATPPAPHAPAVTAAPAPIAFPRAAHKPRTVHAGGDDDPDVDDYSPRRRSWAVVTDAQAEAAGDGARSAAGAPHGDGRPASYPGTLPPIIDFPPHTVPPAPRRVVRPGSDNGPGSGPGGDLHWTPDALGGVAAIPAPRAHRDPWAPPIDEPPEPPVRATRYSPAPDDSGLADSAEVSAVPGAPALGDPVAARSSVSAMNDEPEVPEAESVFGDTLIGARRRTPWLLTPPLGAPIPVTSNVLIVGRRPGVDPAFPHAQLVPVADETRTMSKTHARLELDGDGWKIVDLDSTNGVLLLHPDGTEVDLVSGRPEPVTEMFLLGDAEMRLARNPGAE